MTVKIRETGETVDLSIIDPKTGVNYIADFVGNTEAFNREFAEYDHDNDYYIADEADVAWWQAVIEVHEHAGYVLAAMDDTFDNDDYEAINRDLQDVMSGDLDVFATPADFDDWFREELDGYGYTMTIYSDGSIGFDKA